MKKRLATIAVALIALIGTGAKAQEIPQNKMYQPREFTDFAFEGILLDIDQQTRIDSLNAAVKAKCPVMNATGCQGQQCPKDQSANCAKEGKKCQKAENGVCPKQGKKCQKAENGVCPKQDKQCQKAENGVCPKQEKQCQKAENGVCPKQGKQCQKAECEDKAKMPNGSKHNMHHGTVGPQAKCPYGEEYIAKVKEILTPDQYVVFMENISNIQLPTQNSLPMQNDKMQPQRGKKGDAQMKKAPQKIDNPKKAKAKAK